MSGWVLCEDNERVVIITEPDKRHMNPKTDNMLQTWILAKHADPVCAVRDGSDSPDMR